MATSVPTFFWLLVYLALACGAWLLWTGVRGRRIGDAPFCGRCGRSVAGINSGVCPECGTDLTRPHGVVVGRLVRSLRRTVLGVVMILLIWAVLSAVQSEQFRKWDSAAPVPPLLWLLICLAMAGGAWLLWNGLRGRRVGDAPSCGRCSYSVAGISSDVCPECGADLTCPNGVLFGQRVRKPRRAVVGALAILLALATLTAVRSKPLRNFDWYTLAPMHWVIDDLAKPPSQQRERAWKELERRIRLHGPLKKEDRDVLATIALVEQARSSSEVVGGYGVTKGLLDWLEDEMAHDRLSAAERRCFLENALVASLTVRPVTVAREPVPFQIRLDSAGGATLYGRFSRVDALSLSIDGEPPKTLERSTAGDGLGRGSLILSSITLENPGRHELAFTLHVQVLKLPDMTTRVGPAPAATIQHEYELTLKATVDVVLAEGPSSTAPSR
jgi:hypothetical protein